MSADQTHVFETVLFSLEVMLLLAIFPLPLQMAGTAARSHGPSRRSKLRRTLALEVITRRGCLT